MSNLFQPFILDEVKQLHLRAVQPNHSGFTNSLTSVSLLHTQHLSNPDPDKHRHQRTDITLFGWQISAPPITLLFMPSAPGHPAPFTLLSAKHRRKVISLLSSCHFGTFLFRRTWAVTVGPGHKRTPSYNSLRREPAAQRTRLQIAFTLQQAAPDKWTSYEHLLLDIHQWLATKEVQSKWVLG